MILLFCIISFFGVCVDTQKYLKIRVLGLTLYFYLLLKYDAKV